MLEVRVVRSRRDRNRFLNLPDVLYRSDPYWVRPLKSERDLALDIHRNPFYQHAELELFLATRGGQPLGRIAAIVNHAHNDFHREQTGFFGFFETVDDVEVAGGLIEAAGRWLRDRGMRRLRGPASPSMNAECGVLVE
ncbi:MAG TPA: N-acetyltransferase, partial [Thermoguttaceae bacterium]|nr:N-acetyltransferase [Thermoguttaceae bacterium]